MTSNELQIFIILAPIGWIITSIEYDFLKTLDKKLFISRLFVLNCPTIVVIIELLKNLF